MSASEPSTMPAALKEAESRLHYTLRQLSQTSAVISLLAIVAALILGAVLILAASAEVQSTLSYFFAQPADFFTTSLSVLSEAYSAFFRGAIFDWQASTTTRMIRPITETLVAAIPLILSGLGVAIAFRSGMLNIGGQGQIILGASFAGFIGYSMNLPLGVHVLFAIIGGVLGGAIWGGIAGVLKARTGANEVIVTIMLNNIALLGLGYLLQQNWFTQSESNQPVSTGVEATAQLPQLLGPGFRLHAGILLAVLATVFVWWLLERSTLGFEFRAVGENPEAARTAGISVQKVTALVLVISGALCGLAGAAHLLGTEFRVESGTAGSIGFDALTVALLGRSRPIGTFLAGLLFGGFSAGGVLMQAQTGTSIDIVLVLQSVIVLLIAAPPLVRALFFLPRADGLPRSKRQRRAAGIAETVAKERAA